MPAPEEDTRTLVDRAEEDLTWAGLAIAETLRVVELAAIALVVLVFTPPLLILLVVVIVPTIVFAAVVGVIALPIFVVRRFHRHRAGHAHHRVRRLAELGRERAGTATSRFHRAMARALAKLGRHEPAL